MGESLLSSGLWQNHSLQTGSNNMHSSGIKPIHFLKFAFAMYFCLWCVCDYHSMCEELASIFEWAHLMRRLSTTCWLTERWALQLFNEFFVSVYVCLASVYRNIVVLASLLLLQNLPCLCKAFSQPATAEVTHFNLQNRKTFCNKPGSISHHRKY